MNKQYPEFMHNLRGQYRAAEPMARHTSWRCGGLAEYFYTPADRADALDLLRQTPAELPIYWVGLGSNLLVRDGGVDGVVAKTKNINQIKFKPPHTLYAQAGASCARVAKFADKNGVGGIEFLASVPGSFGGAVAMNAGAFGGEVWNYITQIECANRAGECKIYKRDEIDFGYRRVALPKDNLVLGGWLDLPPRINGKQRMRELLSERNAKQPVQSANAGSVFVNPKNGFAAKLLEESGMKGIAVGDAVISETHANFIINRGAATAFDIESLIAMAKKRVKGKTGVALVTEVHIIGRHREGK